MAKRKFYYFTRLPNDGNPGGITVSKQETLPAGDFRITEYRWGREWSGASLWFVDADRFTADERQEAYYSRSQSPKPQ